MSTEHIIYCLNAFWALISSLESFLIYVIHSPSNPICDSQPYGITQLNQEILFSACRIV